MTLQQCTLTAGPEHARLPASETYRSYLYLQLCVLEKSKYKAHGDDFDSSKSQLTHIGVYGAGGERKCDCSKGYNSDKIYGGSIVDEVYVLSHSFSKCIFLVAQFNAAFVEPYATFPGVDLIGMPSRQPPTLLIGTKRGKVLFLRTWYTA